MDIPENEPVSEASLSVNAGYTVREMEKKLIFRTLEDVNDNRTRAAELLGISIRTLRNKLREYREDGDVRIEKSVVQGIDKNFAAQSYTAQRLDPNLNPINVEIEKKSNQFKFVSGEVSYHKKNSYRVDARYDYDINFQTTSRGEISGRYEAIKNLGLSLYYNYREPRIRYNSIFAVFDYGNTWEIGGGLDYQIENRYTVIGKFANVSYKNETSQRVTLGISSPWGSITGRKSFGYAGEMDAVSVYMAQSVLNALLTPSFGFSFTLPALPQTQVPV